MLLGTLTTGSGTDNKLYTGAAAPPNAAPALNATNLGGGYSGSSTVPVAIPSTVKVDDIIVIVFAYGWWQAPTAPAGWNQILAAQASSPYNAATGVWWKKAVAGDIGASVNISSASPEHVSWCVASYSDTDGTGPQHVTATGASQTFAVLTGLPANSRVVYAAGGAIIGACSTPAVSTIGSDVATFSGTGGGDASEAVIGSEVIAAGGSNPARTASLPNIAASDSAVVTFSLNPNPAAVAQNGDTFLDKTHRRFYGQMAGGVWGTSTGLRHNDPVAKTAAYTAVDGDVVLANATTAAFTVTLPAVTAGATVVVKKIDSSANAVTVTRAGTATVDGATSTSLTTQWAEVVVISDGTNWFVLGGSGATGVAALSFNVDGVVAVGTGAQRFYNDTGRTLTIGTCRASVGTAPASSACTVDVNKNGATIFTTQANRPSVAVSGVTGTGVPDITTLANGEFLTVDVDATDGTAANLVVQIALS